MTKPVEAAAPPITGRLGGGLRGAMALAGREIHRPYVLPAETLIGPAITAVLFYLVFTIASAGGGDLASGLAVPDFVTPGILTMLMSQTAFANPSFAFVLGKFLRNVEDLMIAPMGPTALLWGFASGAVLRGVTVGLLAAAAMALVGAFSGLDGFRPVQAISFAVLLSLFFGLCGVLTGIWANSFDELGLVMNFIVIPVSFLSGAFFGAEALPGAWVWVAWLNPVYHMVEGFRGAFVARETNLVLAYGIAIGANLLMGGLTWLAFRSGWRLIR